MTYISIHNSPAEISSFSEVLYHTGSQADFEERLKTCLWQPDGSSQLKANNHALRTVLNDQRNLQLAYRNLQLKGEKAPGPDGIQLQDIPSCQIPSLLREVARALNDHTYNPGPVRKVQIPKPNGSTRTLSIRNLIDRIVAKAYQQILSPVLDQEFCDLSHGGRPKRDRQTALASALYFANQDDRFLWVSIDLQDAFNCVPLERLDYILRKRGLEDLQLRKMILRMAKTSDKKGVQQGCALSPLLFNLYMDGVLDYRWSKQHPDIPMLRYLDDVILLCRDTQEAREGLESLENLLVPAGFRLQSHKTQQVDLRKEADHIDWLGFRISLKGGGCITPTKEAWEKLGGYFEKNGKPLSDQDIDLRIQSWIRAMGPALGQQARQQLGGQLTQHSLPAVSNSYYRHSSRYQRAATEAFLKGRARMWWAMVVGRLVCHGEGSASHDFLSDFYLSAGEQVPLSPVLIDSPQQDWSVFIHTEPATEKKRKSWVAMVVNPNLKLKRIFTGQVDQDSCRLPFIAFQKAQSWLLYHTNEVRKLTVLSPDQELLDTIQTQWENDDICEDPQTDDLTWNSPSIWQPYSTKIERLDCDEFRIYNLSTPFDELIWNERLLSKHNDYQSVELVLN